MRNRKGNALFGFAAGVCVGGAVFGVLGAVVAGILGAAIGYTV